MKLKKRIYSLVWLLMLLTTFTQVCAGDALEQKHLNWQSRVIVNDGYTAFRALTTYTEARVPIILAMDRHPNDCPIQYISMIVALSEAAKSTIDPKQNFGALRIDEMPTRNINFTLSAKAGDKFLFVTVTNFDKETTIVDELKRGTTLRFKLIVEGREFYPRFSLVGFTAASTRSLELCTQFNANRPDNRFFSPELKVKSDKDYF